MISQKLNIADIAQNLKQLVSVIPIAQVIWTGYNKSALTRAIVEEFGSSSADTICNSVDLHLIVNVLTRIANELGQVSEESELNLAAIASSVNSIDTSTLSTKASLAVLRSLMHCSLRSLAAAKNVRQAYANSKEIIHLGENIEEPKVISKLRLRGMEIVKECAQLGLGEDGTKKMGEMVAEFELEYPVANLMQDLREEVQTLSEVYGCNASHSQCHSRPHCNDDDDERDTKRIQSETHSFHSHSKSSPVEGNSEAYGDYSEAEPTFPISMDCDE